MNKNILAWSNWAIATFFVIFQFYLQTSAGIMAHLWQKDFNLTALSVANLSAAFFYVYVFMQIPVGLIYDRFPLKWILTFAGFTLFAGCLIFALTHNYYIAFFARMVMGIGAAFGFVGMLHICANWFSIQNFPLMVSLAETIGMVAIAFGEILLAVIVSALGWRQSMLYAALIAFILTVIIMILVRDKSAAITENLAQNYKKLSILKTMKLLSLNKQVWLTGLYGFFNFSLITVFTALWGIPFLRRIYGYNLHQSATMIAMIFLGVSIGTLIMSFLSFKIGRRKPVMFFGPLVTAILFGIINFSTDLPSFAIYILLFFCGFFSATYVLSFALSKETIPSNVRSTALATVNMLIMLSAPLLQTLIGYFISTGFFGLLSETTLIYRLSLSILTAGFFISAVLVLFMQESYCIEMDYE